MRLEFVMSPCLALTVEQLAWFCAVFTRLCLLDVVTALRQLTK